MTDPIWFAVERTPSGEFAAIYHQVLPSRLTEKIVAPRVSPLVYSCRLDKLPDCATWLQMSTAELYRRYALARDGGRLVHNTADPPREKGATGRILGEYWEPKSIPFNHDPRVDKPPPADPLPEPMAGGLHDWRPLSGYETPAVPARTWDDPDAHEDAHGR